MNSPHRIMEAVLADVGDHIDWPEPSDLTTELGRRLVPATTRPWRRRWTPVTATLVVLVASLLLLSPQTRQAVADLLGVAGIEIGFEPELEDPIGSGLDLGRAVGLEEAVGSVDFLVSVPDEMGDPDGVFLSDHATGARVSLVWEGDETLPAGADTGIGLLYVQFASNAEGGGFIKSLGPGTALVRVEVAGSPAVWIEGAPHVISYEDAAGTRVEESTRLAGNVLMWESEGVTHRIETMQSLQQTLRIAESIQP